MRFLLMQLLSHLLILTGLNYAASVSGGLKWVRVNIPQYRVPGEMAQLQCEYDLGNDTLYAVKWYKEHEEFYRFVPKAKPPSSSYKVEGVHVDMSLSDSKKVVLRKVNLKTSGLFRCEVSAEAPSFASAQSEARMEVVSLPKEDPIITGVEMQYQIGDEINLNCTSGKSHPESILHWYINEQQVSSPDALRRYEPIQHHHGLVSSTLGLRFILSERHFLGGSMRVKCVASLSPVLWRGDRESVVQSQPIKDMREAQLLALPKEDPIITGVEMQYQIGDEINLNCTSGKSHPESILHWYINEQQVSSPDALRRYEPIQHHHGLVSSTLGLRFILSERHFLGGSMRVKCVASLSPVLWRGDRESVVQSQPIKDMREAQLLVKSGCPKLRLQKLLYFLFTVAFLFILT